jgi:hypothetical protein
VRGAVSDGRPYRDTEIVTEKKRVSIWLFGLQWRPLRAFFVVWTPFGLQDSTSRLAQGLLFMRAVAQAFVCCLLEKTTKCFLYRAIGAHLPGCEEVTRTGGGTRTGLFRQKLMAAG